MMDINTVSAGGGTIARVDRFGVLQVGPDSAGAMPGPACNSRGGEMPTITDCNLVMGHLSAENFLGGRMRLDAEKAWRAVESKIAKPLGMGVEEAAEGVVRIIDVKMEGRSRPSPPCVAMTCATSCYSPLAAPARCMPAAWRATSAWPG
jgi:N-methylhydantoinase A